MLAALRRLHDRVLEALNRNAETAGRLLQGVTGPRVRVPANGHSPRVTTDLTLYRWNGKRWERCILVDSEE